MLSWPVDFRTVVSVCVLAIVLVFTYVARRFSNKGGKLPQTKPSMFENMKMLQNQAGLTKMMHLYNLCQSFKEGDWGRFQHGVTFEFKFPTWDPFIVTTDYELARHFLQGDEEQDKAPFMKMLNTIDRDTANILTHYTSNADREKARKGLAPSFSTTNLQQTWPFLEDGLVEEFKKLRTLSQTGELLNCRDNVLMFLLRMLGRSAFGIEFTEDGTEGPDSINGLEYLEVQGIAASERMKEMAAPFRRYYFWDKRVQLGAQCCERLKEMSAKMLRLFEEHEGGGESAAVSAGGKAPKRQSIMRAIAHHPYPTENARLADINVMTFAGHDTTGFSLCFLLMELGRHPEIRAKLQAEIATVMPKEPLGHHTASVAYAAAGADEGAAGPLRHGDQKLLSAICGLDYLNQCIRESMRLWPVAAIGSVRQLDKDMHWKGMVFPKGSSIRSHNFSMFRESWIDRPLEFRPERWAADSPQLAELKEMFLPFSLGKRACIGQNMAMFQLRIIAAYFLHYFDFTLVGEPDFEYFITLKPVNLFLKVQERAIFV